MNSNGMRRTGAVAVLLWAAIAFATHALAQGGVSSMILPEWALQRTYQMDLYTELVRAPVHDGRDSGVMADTIPAA